MAAPGLTPAPFAELVRIEEPPLFLVSDLYQQSVKCTTANDKAGVSLSIRSEQEAREIIRIFVAHNAVVPDHIFELIGGTLTAAKVKALISSERTKMLGPKSFLRKAVEGKMSTFHFTTIITNLRLDARYWAIPPTTAETAHEGHVRRIRSQLFDIEASRVQDFYIDAYRHALAQAHAEKNSLRGNSSEVVDWIRRIAHYDNIIANPPRCELDVSTLVTRSQVLAAKHIPSKNQTQAARLSIWRSKLFNADVMASLFSDSRGIVDVRRLMFNGDPETVRLSFDDDAVVHRARADQSRYRDIWRNALPHLCDTLYLNVVGAEYFADWMKSVCADSGVRMAINRTAMPAFEPYKGMENICRREIFDPVKFGTWKDVPILCQGLRGSRNLERHHTKAATVAVEDMEEDIYVFSDDDWK
ncbi:hypothetical protein N0V94_005512 [Neodidymelliopsis sp. IMI 364377]|nr:hypothetical protein N0V94_005512 [Neodidymelliopsis sp. IMI 364377]